MTKKVKELLTHKYYNQYKRFVMVHKINIAKIDREYNYIESLISIVGIPTLYVVGYYNKKTQRINIILEEYWQGGRI